MVAYSFKRRFAAPILFGRKRQTIRADRKRHARPGETTQLYTGMRTRFCRKLGTATCAEAVPVLLNFDAGSVVFPDGRFLSLQCELDRFARDDGFLNWEHLVSFWRSEHGLLPFFNGVLIRWQDFQPCR